MNALVTASSPSTFTSISFFISGPGTSSSGPFSDSPALLIKPNNSPDVASVTILIVSAIELSSVTSRCMGVSLSDASFDNA